VPFSQFTDGRGAAGLNLREDWQIYDRGEMSCLCKCTASTEWRKVLPLLRHLKFDKDMFLGYNR
jgi:hypothetical protein